MKQYTMVCKQGEYCATSWLALGWEIFKHRFWHFRQGHGWVD